MSGDVAAAAAAGVGAPRMVQAIEQAARPGCRQHPVHGLQVGGAKGEHLGQIAAIPLIGHITFGQTDVAAEKQAPDDPRMVQADGRLGAWVGAAKGDPPAGRKAHRQHAAIDVLAPALEDALPKSGGADLIGQSGVDGKRLGHGLALRLGQVAVAEAAGDTLGGGPVAMNFEALGPHLQCLPMDSDDNL